MFIILIYEYYSTLFNGTTFLSSPFRLLSLLVSFLLLIKMMWPLQPIKKNSRCQGSFINFPFLLFLNSTTPQLLPPPSCALLRPTTHHTFRALRSVLIKNVDLRIFSSQNCEIIFILKPSIGFAIAINKQAAISRQFSSFQ